MNEELLAFAAVGIKRGVLKVKRSLTDDEIRDIIGTVSRV